LTAPSRTSLARGLIRQAWENIQKHLPEFVGTHIFEELCREWAMRQGDAGKLQPMPSVERRSTRAWPASASYAGSLKRR
jgi:hypothetical protein